MIIQFWIWSPKNTRKTPTSASFHSVVSVHTVLHLSPLSSACSCASTSCRSSSHCVTPRLSESSTSVLSANVLRRNTHFHLVLQRVACHQDTVVSFLLLSMLWRTPPVPTWSSPKPHCPVSPGPNETARTTRLVLTSSIPRGDYPRSVSKEYQPIRTPKHSSSLQSNTCDTSCSVSDTEAKSLNSSDNLRAITPDALLTRT